jgi:hypothetical protein
LYGIELLPQGRRRASLQIAVARVFDEMFACRVLTFDGSAYAFAMIAARHRLGGRTVGELDSQIAGIAGSGVELINPWG